MSLERLTYLKQLLVDLPELTPYNHVQSTNYDFSVSGEEIEEYGDETSAINHRLEVNFGPRCRVFVGPFLLLVVTGVTGEGRYQRGSLELPSRLIGTQVDLDSSNNSTGSAGFRTFRLVTC